MKGLLIKDWKLLKNQKTFIVVVVIISISFIISGKNTAYGFTYLSALIAVLSTTTIGYDEFNNGMEYLFTLPISRRHYVLEKYIFGLAMLAPILAAASAAVALLSANGYFSLEKGELAAMSASGIVTAVIIQSVTIPIQLKFGSEKSRIAYLAIFAGAWIIGYGIQKIGNFLSFDAAALIRQLEQASAAAALAIVAILALALTGISFIISLAVMKRKQF